MAPRQLPSGVVPSRARLALTLLACATVLAWALGCGISQSGDCSTCSDFGTVKDATSDVSPYAPILTPSTDATIAPFDSAPPAETGPPPPDTFTPCTSAASCPLGEACLPSGVCG